MKIIVIGAVASGTSVMSKARRNSEDVEIRCYTKERNISYSTCGIPYYIGEDYIVEENLIPRDTKWFKSRFNIDIHNNYEVLEIKSLEKKIVIRDNFTGKIFEDFYDKLVIATGGRAKKLKFENENIFYVRNVEDGNKIKEYILDKKPKNALVVGGGFIGVEMLENLANKDISVTLIEKNDKIGGNLDRDMSDKLIEFLRSRGVKILLNDEIESIEDNLVKTRKGEKIIADIVVGAIGILPNTEFLKSSGIELAKNEAIRINKYLETNVKDIYAVGDCAMMYSKLTGEECYTPLGSTANKMGRILGDRLTGGNLEFNGVLGTSIFKIFDMVVGKTGLTQEEAENKGYSLEIIYNIKPNQTEYIKSSKEMLIKAIADKKTGKLLGIQIFGGVGVDKRLDIFAVLLNYGATVDELFHLDLAYAPPFSTTKDPVAYTGMILDNAINGKNKLITPEKLRENREEYLIIDVRSKKQYDEGHIEGAINIPIEILREKLKKLDKDKKIVVHCNKGTTGNMAQNILLNNGFKVYNLSGGYKNYI